MPSSDHTISNINIVIRVDILKLIITFLKKFHYPDFCERTVRNVECCEGVRNGGYTDDRLAGRESI